MVSLEHTHGDGLRELIRQHKRLRELLGDLIEYTQQLEHERCADCPSHQVVIRAGDGIATLEWRMPS